MQTKYNRTNFFKHTYCQFEFKTFDVLKEENIHFKSKSGSTYVYTEEGVYRHSNHWGRVANCRWKLNGVTKYQNQNYYVGYAKWTDFYSLTSDEKLFGLKIDFETEKVEVYKPEEKEKEQLFNLTVIFKKKKEVEEVFKNTKWMQYHNKELEVLQERIIEKILTTNKSLQQIKLELS